jgi:molybdenum cofactor biosynthesis enzyme MoaA
MSAFVSAFLWTHRPIDPVARAIADRRAWERAIARWSRRERRLSYQRDYVGDWIARRVADGFCSACRARLAPEGRLTCQLCRDAISDARKRLRADRLAAGLCGVCGKRPRVGKTCCAECLAIDAKRAAAYAAKRRGL